MKAAYFLGKSAEHCSILCMCVFIVGGMKINLNSALVQLAAT